MRIKDLVFSFPIKHKKRFKRHIRDAQVHVDMVPFKIAAQWANGSEFYLRHDLRFKEAIARAEASVVATYAPSGYQMKLAAYILSKYWTRGKRFRRVWYKDKAVLQISGDDVVKK